MRGWPIDIVVTTMNRLDCLQATLGHIYERTRSDYRLHVINDASDEGNRPWLVGELEAGRVHHLLLHGERSGQMANLNQGAWMAYSDPVILTDDDILCPDVEPDWLHQLVTAIRARPKLALLALNHPNAVRKKTGEVDGQVTYCLAVGGTFMAVRRQWLLEHPLPHLRYNYGITPTTKRSAMARASGAKIGYLTDVYCKHIGRHSVLTGQPHGWYHHIEDVDPMTLEPYEERYRG